MASIRTSRGIFHYKPKHLYLGIKQMDRDVAFENLKIVWKVLNGLKIHVTPAQGTLLGIIRDNNFIEWDEDIDLFILKEDKDKFLDSLWILKENGFELIREERCGYLYSIIRNNEYIDIYVMERISPEVRTAYSEFFILEKYLTELIDWDFRGMTLKIPKDYEELLFFLYGDWRTPVQWANFHLSDIQILKAKVKTFLKRSLPYKIRFYLMKKHHKHDLKLFLERCKKKGVELQYPIHY